MNSRRCSRAVTFVHGVSRVSLSFSSGLPAILDLAAMRDAAITLGIDPHAIQPKIATTLLLDYYNIEADVARK